MNKVTACATGCDVGVGSKCHRYARGRAVIGYVGALRRRLVAKHLNNTDAACNTTGTLVGSHYKSYSYGIYTLNTDSRRLL